MKCFYVTGIAGMLGYNIFRMLHNRLRITGNDMVDIAVPELSYQKISLLDMNVVEQDILREDPDVLIHTAAMVNVDGCEQEPEVAKRLNTDVTAELAQICSKHNIKMVYISTDMVFDGELCDLYTEQDKVNPINVYARTKLEGEKAVLQYPENLVLRTNIYGSNIQRKKSFGEWIYTSLLQNDILKMFTDIDFSPILADELANLIYEACTQDLKGVYHACGTGCMTKHDFGLRLKDVFGIKTGVIKRATSEEMLFKAKRPKHMGMSNKKICDRLQIKISTPEESIIDFYKQIKSV